MINAACHDTWALTTSIASLGLQHFKFLYAYLTNAIFACHGILVLVLVFKKLQPQHAICNSSSLGPISITIIIQVFDKQGQTLELERIKKASIAFTFQMNREEKRKGKIEIVTSIHGSLHRMDG